VNVDKGADRAFIGFDIATASDSDPPASGGQNDTGDEKYDRIFFIGNLPRVNTMQQCPAVDSRKMAFPY
jgi:hypothetical protein